MNLFLAGLHGRQWFVDEYLKTKGGAETVDVYMAGVTGLRSYIEDEVVKKIDGKKIDIAILESFYYANEWTEWAIPRLSKFLLDSGAFTYLSQGKSADWNDYLRRYVDFINRNDVKLFFELDIDPLVGYENVLKLRRKLEDRTGKKCIPVWHKSRGKDEFLRMCDEYDYVAIGGIVTQEIKRDEHKYFPWFIKEAHKRGAKIHGLGYTNLKGLERYHFDSVDSTSWTTGNRFGLVYKFDGHTMRKYEAGEGQRLKDARASAVNNFNEWVKFQQYARLHL